MRIRKPRSTQRVLDSIGGDIPDHALAQRNVTHPINQREDLNVSDLVLSKGPRGGMLIMLAARQAGHP